jgi:hypothetical protein
MNASPDQKLKFYPLDIYGDTKLTTRIFHWFIAAVIFSLITGIIISLSTTNTDSAIFIAAGILPVFAALFLVHYKKFVTVHAFN